VLSKGKLSRRQCKAGLSHNYSDQQAHVHACLRVCQAQRFIISNIVTRSDSPVALAGADAGAASVAVARAAACTSSAQAVNISLDAPWYYLHAGITPAALVLFFLILRP